MSINWNGVCEISKELWLYARDLSLTEALGADLWAKDLLDHSEEKKAHFTDKAFSLVGALLDHLGASTESTPPIFEALSDRDKARSEVKELKRKVAQLEVEKEEIAALAKAEIQRRKDVQASTEAQVEHQIAEVQRLRAGFMDIIEFRAKKRVREHCLFVLGLLEQWGRG